MFKKIYIFRDRWNRMSPMQRAEQVFKWLVFYCMISAVAAAFLTIMPASAATEQLSQDSINAAAYSSADPDLSGIGILRKVFGQIVDSPLSPAGGETVLGNVMMILNASLLSLGTIWLTYNISAGVAQTAQDGEFLGKRFSSLWIPARLTAGIVSLVPIFKGFALSQLFMIWFAVMGVGIGNLASSEVAKYLDQHGTVVNVPVTSVNQKFVADLYLINLCTSAYNATTTGAPFAGRVTGNYKNYGINNDTQSQCGSVELPNSNIVAAQRASLQAFNQIDQLIKQHTDHLVAEVSKAYMADQSAAPNVLNIKSDIDIEGFARTYQDALRSNLASALNTQTHLASSLSNQGFIGLGMYYSKLSGIQNAKNEAAQTQAKIIKPAPGTDELHGGLGEVYRIASILINSDADQAKTALAALKLPPSDEGVLISEFNKKASGAIPSSGCNNAPAGTGLGQGILALAINATGCDSSAINRMKTVGDYLGVLGWIGIAVGAAAHALEAVPIAGKSIMVFVDLFTNIMQIMTFFALMLSTYLPLIPFIAWLGAIISWITVVIEGVVAAPLWAFAHLDTDGEGMGNRTERGYTFILNVLLRPVLMVVGFLACVILCDVMGSVFFKMYLSAVAESSAGSFTGLTALVVYIAIFFTTSVMLVTTCAGLIHTVPDTVLTWITQSTASAGAGSGMHSQFGVASTGATGAGTSMMSQSMQKAGWGTGGELSKNREAANRLDMENRMKKMREQSKK